MDDLFFSDFYPFSDDFYNFIVTRTLHPIYGSKAFQPSFDVLGEPNISVKSLK